MELLDRFAKGDLEAFETLFRQLQAEVYGWIVRIVRDSGAAEDLTIETFWRMYRAHARFDPRRPIGAWARKIATNAALDYLRTRRPESPLLPEIAQAPSADPALRMDMRAQIRRAFDRLPPNLRLVAMLALVEEMPYEDIADAVGISVGAVKVRVFRAVRRLRKQLDPLRIHS